MAADKIIVVTVTEGFRHDSIPTAEGVIADLAPRLGYEVDFVRDRSELPAALSPTALKDVKVVMFVNTTGDLAAPLDSLLAWVADGGSFIGVHSASDTWHESPAYIAMLGGEFDHHPDQTARTIFVDSTTNPATASLPPSHDLFEEYYIFKNFDRNRVTMLLSMRTSPEDGGPGFYPLAWTHDYAKGRVFYTALGQRIDGWTSGWFQQQL